MGRLAKQLFIGSIYLIIFGTIGYGAYDLLTADPTCSDGRRNQGEEGVDCGTVCGVLCGAALEPLEVSEPLPYSSYTSSGGFDVLVELDNPNTIYGAVRVDWTMMLQDGSGEEQATRRGFTYVNPLEIRRLVVSFPGVAGGVDWSASFDYDPDRIQWVQGRLPEMSVVDFSVLNEALTVSDDGQATYRADVRNESSFDFDEVDVTVILYDASGADIAVGSTIIRTLPANGLRAFTVNWPELGRSQEPVGLRAETVVTTNVFNNANFIRTYGGQERFQGFQ